MRCDLLVWEKLPNARRAAATALSTSVEFPMLTRATDSSVAGLTTSTERGEDGSTHAPSM